MDQHLPTDPHAEIRAEVAKLCARFPGEYWRALDRERAYPTRVRAGSHRSRLPRRADPGGVRRHRPRRLPPPRPSWRRSTPRAATPAPAMRRCTSWAPCCGTAAKSRSSDYLPKIATGELRLQAFGVTEPTTGSDTIAAQHHRRARRRPLRRQRPEGVDLARRAFGPDAAAGAHHAARPGRSGAATGSRCSSSTCAPRSATA